jgi:formiminotetrahydrofolate cyclodeaminase
MGFYKGMFRVARIDGTVKVVEGWFEDTNTYGFHKLMKIGSKCGEPRAWKWIATDIASGMRVCEGATRKACSDWISANVEKIKEKKDTEEYKKWVRQFLAHNGRVIND